VLLLICWRTPRAIAFNCWIGDEWRRIGYVVKKVLDAVHNAKDMDEITNVSFKLANIWSPGPNLDLDFMLVLTYASKDSDQEWWLPVPALDKVAT